MKYPCCQLCSIRYTAFQIKNCSKSTSTIHTYQKKEIMPRVPIICLKSEVSIMLCCRLCSIPYTAVRIKNCLKSTSAINIAMMKNMDDFYFEGKLSRARAKSTPFPVSKDEWDTKEDTGESMKNVLYILQYAKRHLSGRLSGVADLRA